MKEYELNYYPYFKCISNKCKHTCCAGWEMNIDEHSLECYKNEQSQFKSTLQKGINFKKSKFKTDKLKRCAFLNDKGLCEIIINLGENSLCQVCRDHPRFRNYFNDRVEMGLGLTCEQASRIVLSFEDKIVPILTIDDKESADLDFNQKNVLEFRKKALDLVQDRALSIDERINNLLTLSKANISEKDFSKIIKTFLSLEKVDKTFSNRLKSIKNSPKLSTEKDFSLWAEQFLVNSLYRHLSDAEDTMWVRARTIACVLGWWLINAIIENERTENTSLFEVAVDVVRAYSTEVEYSFKNLQKLFNLAYEFIKI